MYTFYKYLLCIIWERNDKLKKNKINEYFDLQLGEKKKKLKLLEICF